MAINPRHETADTGRHYLFEVGVRRRLPEDIVRQLGRRRLFTESIIEEYKEYVEEETPTEERQRIFGRLGIALTYLADRETPSYTVMGREKPSDPKELSAVRREMREMLNELYGGMADMIRVHYGHDIESLIAQDGLSRSRERETVDSVGVIKGMIEGRLIDARFGEALLADLGLGTLPGVTDDVSHAALHVAVAGHLHKRLSMMSQTDRRAIGDGLRLLERFVGVSPDGTEGIGIMTLVDERFAAHHGDAQKQRVLAGIQGRLATTIQELYRPTRARGR